MFVPRQRKEKSGNCFYFRLFAVPQLASIKEKQKPTQFIIISEIPPNAVFKVMEVQSNSLNALCSFHTPLMETGNIDIRIDRLSPRLWNLISAFVCVIREQSCDIMCVLLPPTGLMALLLLLHQNVNEEFVQSEMRLRVLQGYIRLYVLQTIIMCRVNVKLKFLPSHISLSVIFPPPPLSLRNDKANFNFCQVLF